jgi:hypothetical protein
MKAMGPNLPHATSTPIGTSPGGYPAPIHAPFAFERIQCASPIKEAWIFELSPRTVFTIQRAIYGWETYRVTL